MKLKYYKGNTVAIVTVSTEQGMEFITSFYDSFEYIS